MGFADFLIYKITFAILFIIVFVMVASSLSFGAFVPRSGRLLLVGGVLIAIIVATSALYYWKSSM